MTLETWVVSMTLRCYETMLASRYRPPSLTSRPPWPLPPAPSPPLPPPPRPPPRLSSLVPQAWFPCVPELPLGSAWGNGFCDGENYCNDSGDFGDVSLSLIYNVLVSGEIYLGTLNWGDCEICQIFEKLYFVRGISQMMVTMVIVMVMVMVMVMVTMVMVMYLCRRIQCAGVCSDRRGRRIMYERGTGGTFWET